MVSCFMFDTFLFSEYMIFKGNILPGEHLLKNENFNPQEANVLLGYFN